MSSVDVSRSRRPTRRINHLGKIVRNTCRCPDTQSSTGEGSPIFYKTTTPNPKQRKALDLLRNITV